MHEEHEVKIGGEDDVACWCQPGPIAKPLIPSRASTTPGVPLGMHASKVKATSGAATQSAAPGPTTSCRAASCEAQSPNSQDLR